MNCLAGKVPKRIIDQQKAEKEKSHQDKKQKNTQGGEK